MVSTTTLNIMLPEFAEYLGLLIQSSDSSNKGQFTTTTNIAGDTTVVSTELRDEGFSTDRLNDAFIRITSGNNDDAIRRISDYDGDTGTLTVTGTNLTADSSSANFELYWRQPRRLIQALNNARLRAYPVLYSEVNDRTLTYSHSTQLYGRPSSIPPQHVKQVFVEPRLPASTFNDNIIRDSSGVMKDVGFEESTITTDWTGSGITLTAESSDDSPRNYLVFEGTQSGKCVATASQVDTLLCGVDDNVYVGVEVNFSIWVYSQTASRISAVIYEDSAQTAASTQHGGTGWERLSVAATPAQGISTLEVGIEVSSGAAITFWVDEAVAVAGQSEGVRLHATPVYWWREEGDNIRIDQTAPDLGQLLVRGEGYLSEVTAGTDTMEVDAAQRRLLYNYAALDLVAGGVWTDSGDDQNEVLRTQTFFQNRADEGVGSMAQMAVIRRSA